MRLSIFVACSALPVFFGNVAFAGVETRVSAAAEYHSRFVSEARDSANGEALRVGSLTVNRGDWEFGTWFGASDKRRYDQLEFGIGRSFVAGPVEIGVGYTHLRYYADDTLDNEWSISATVGGDGPIELGLESYYSREQRGAWWELSLRAGLLDTTTAAGSNLTVGLNAALSANDGYISDGHDGTNGFETGIELGYSLTDTLGLTAYMAHNAALNVDDDLPGDDNLENLWFGRVTLKWQPQL